MIDAACCPNKQSAYNRDMAKKWTRARVALGLTDEHIDGLLAHAACLAAAPLCYSARRGRGGKPMAFDNPGKTQIANGSVALNAQDFLALGPAGLGVEEKPSACQ